MTAMGIKMKIYKHLPLDARAWLFEKHLMNRSWGYYDEIYSNALEKAYDTFLIPEKRTDEKYIKDLTRDIVKCWLKYKAMPYEYFLFGFNRRNDEERMSFETDADRIETLCRVSNVQLYHDEILNKFNFYQLAYPFFKREAMKIETGFRVEDFVDFVKKHGDVFIKPLTGSKGFGARVYSYGNDDDAQVFCMQLLAEGTSWMVEERIKQSDEMAQWNETSVNTIRIPTFIRDDQFTVNWTRMRMGKRGSIVDNAGAGGIVVNVNPKTGVVESDGIDESYHHFITHPDLGRTFKGWQVPRWSELLKIVEELHRDVFNKHVYIAWDFALTDEGWVVIEGNWGQFLGWQTASQVGVRRQFHELVGDGDYYK